MKKSMILALVMGVVLSGVFVGSAVFAQGPQPQEDPQAPAAGAYGFSDFNEDGNGYVEDYMIDYAVEILGLTAEEIQTKLDDGLTLADIALENGVVDYAAFMADAREYAVVQMAEDGIVIPGWTNERGVGNQAGGQEMYLNGDSDNCLYSDGSTLAANTNSVYRGGRN